MGLKPCQRVRTILVDLGQGRFFQLPQASCLARRARLAVNLVTLGNDALWHAADRESIGSTVKNLQNSRYFAA